jgi:predicted nucleic acid-binding protein
MAKICADAGFLIALYDNRDSHHEDATARFNALFAPDSLRNVLLAPWPILYESLNTRQARRSHTLRQLSADWTILERSEQLILLSDGAYRDQALRDYLDATNNGPRDLSLADRVIRAVLADPENTIDVLLTYNSRDFADICAIHRVFLVDQNSELIDIPQL